MAIRMVEDNDPSEDYNNDNDRGGGGRGGGGGNLPGGGLMGLLPMLLGLMKGKGGIVLLLALGACAYFLFFNKGCGGLQNQAQELVKKFSGSGYSFDRDKLMNTDIYEPLDETNSANAIRESVDLSNFAPSIGDQQQQGSCVAWSSAYAARTIMEASSQGVNPNQVRFSPSFLYNNIGLEGCQGSYIENAMQFMQKNGNVPLSQFDYDPNDCSREPSSGLYQQAQQYRIRGYHRLTNGNTDQISIRAIKEHLNKDAPVVIGMLVGQSFMGGMRGQELWQPDAGDANMRGLGGHAMCLVGYDDRKFGGAFKIMNSWGTQWGKDGYGWVRYGDFKEYVREAYGMDPLPKSAAMQNLPLECRVALVDKAAKKYIPLTSKGNNVFGTIKPVKVGSRFKIEINNIKECYIYVLADSLEARSDVLFPYTPKHAPFCGITGSRVFPKDWDMTPDNVGNKDRLAVIISKEALDYKALNAAVNASRATGFAAKVADAMRSYKPIANAQMKAESNGAMYCKSQGDPNSAVYMIVEIDKTP
jgi:hypothetical protein